MDELMKKETKESGHLICRECNIKEVEENCMDSTFRLKCNLCFSFNKDKLRSDWMHYRTINLDVCQYCCNAYKFQTKLEVHECRRVGIYQCTLCAYQFYSYKSLTVHLKVAHSDRTQCDIVTVKQEHPPKLFMCNICNVSFSKKYLKEHMRTHTGEKPYQCEVCRKPFTQAQHLTTHLKTHTGEKPYECEFCKKAFSTLWNLKRHLRTHTGEKPFECNLCLKAFADSKSHQRHLRTHTGEKPYPCELCDKSFTQTQHLKTHLKMHMGEKPYVCKFCKKAFSKLWNMQRHSNTHHIQKTS